MRKKRRARVKRRALQNFIDTIEAAGGIYRFPSGVDVPVGDPTWSDLGEAYVVACSALKREPLIAENHPALEPVS